MVQIAPPGEPVTIAAFVYAESASRRKQFFIPVEDGGRTVHEAPVDAPAISDFYLEPDPRVVAALEQARRS